VTDSGWIDAAVSTAGVGAGAGVAVCVGVGVGGGAVTNDGVGVGVVVGRAGLEGLLQPDSMSSAAVVRNRAGTLIPMPIERSTIRLGSASAESRVCPRAGYSPMDSTAALSRCARGARPARRGS